MPSQEPVSYSGITKPSRSLDSLPWPSKSSITSGAQLSSSR